MTVEVFRAEPDGAGLRVGVVQARFNDAVCDRLREACLSELAVLGVQPEDVFCCTVPGALELPFALERLARSGEFDALVALGAVIRGETYHFEVVSNESAAGITRVALDTGLPVANAVLTCETDEQAEVRAEEKGREAARVAIEMACLAEAIESFSHIEELDEADEDEDDEADAAGEPGDAR